jgi:CO/xanthine dehydrogenase FAD-binding subunit
MKAAPFEYHAPQTLDEALALLAEFGDEVKVLAGRRRCWPRWRPPGSSRPGGRGGTPRSVRKKYP